MGIMRKIRLKTITIISHHHYLAALLGKLRKRIFIRYKSTYYPIQSNIDSTFSTLLEIKPDSFEQVELPAVYGLNQKCYLEVYSPAIKVYLLPEACISSGSDIVIVNNEVIWAKSFSKLYSKLTPDDPDLLVFNSKKLCVKNKKTKRIVKGNVISLLGQFDTIWAHFLLQFFSKLYYAAHEGLLDESTTVIIPDCNDSNIKEAIDSILGQYSAKIIIAESNTEYQCERLLYFSPVALYPNQATYLIPQEIVFPTSTLKAIKEGLVTPHQRDIDLTTEKLKLFLVRRGLVRNLINWKEVEDYFSKIGFKLIDGKDYSLKEKAELFGKAEVIVGSFSSAFTNIVFSHKAKVLLLMNISRVADTFITALSRIGECEIFGVVGNDNYPSGTHSSYHIDLDVIKNAYRNMIKNGR